MSGSHPGEYNDNNAFNVGNFYPNAFFDYLSRMMPRRLKTVFKWLEYLYVNCGQVFAVIKKFSEYPITSLTYETTDKSKVSKLKEIMDKHLKIKRVLIQVGIDYFLYGNSFSSVVKPFTRYLVCTKCKTKHNALNTEYTWDHAKFKFMITCSNSKCSHKGPAEVVHEKLADPTKMKIIRWDPKNMDLNWNPVTGDTEYFYSMPTDIQNKIKTKTPDKFLLNTLPWEFIETMRTKNVFKFRDGQLFHLKNPAPAGINQEWGYPGLLGCLKPFFYTAILKKGNEATSLERLVPWRILHPQPTSSSNDPGQFVNLQRWKTELQDAIKKWRRDPNMVKLSPIPVGVTEVGGNGRQLLTHQEVAQTEEGIITAMGVPKEFIYGGLSQAGGSVTLRMLENLLFTYTEQIVEYAQWVADHVCSFTGIEKVVVGMVDFKLIDDIQQKQMLGVLYQQGKISYSTLLKSLDLDPEQEHKQMLEEAIAQAQLDQKIQSAMAKIQDSLANKVDAQVKGDPLQFDPMAVMQVAQEQAQQLAQMPQDQRKQQMSMIQAQNPVLYAVVKDALGEISRQQREQGAQLMEQQRMGASNGLNPSTEINITQQSQTGVSPSTPRAGN